MPLNINELTRGKSNEATVDGARDNIVAILCRHYVRERQHVMRFRQHAERITDLNVRRTLLRIAESEAEHADWLAEKIFDYGGKLPTVIDVRCGRETAWAYLRSDLGEEHRCLEEIAQDKAALRAEFPEIAALLERIEIDARKHREEIRAFFANDTMTPWAA